MTNLDRAADPNAPPDDRARAALEILQAAELHLVLAICFEHCHGIPRPQLDAILRLQAAMRQVFDGAVVKGFTA